MQPLTVFKAVEVANAPSPVPVVPLGRDAPYVVAAVPPPPAGVPEAP